MDSADSLEDNYTVAVFPPALLDDDIGTASSVITVRLDPGVTRKDLRAALDGLPDGSALSLESGRVISAEIRNGVEAQSRGIWLMALVGAIAAVVALGQLLSRHARLTEGRARATRGPRILSHAARRGDAGARGAAGVRRDRARRRGGGARVRAFPHRLRPCTGTGPRRPHRRRRPGDRQHPAPRVPARVGRGRVLHEPPAAGTAGAVTTQRDDRACRAEPRRGRGNELCAHGTRRIEHGGAGHDPRPRVHRRRTRRSDRVLGQSRRPRHRSGALRRELRLRGG